MIKFFSSLFESIQKDINANKVLYSLIIGFFLLLIFLSLFITDILYAKDIQLQWDQNTTPIDGYLLYQRKENEEYDYNIPRIIDGQTDAQGRISKDKTLLTVDQLGEDGKSITYSWVLRAFLNRQGTIEQSGDSNEVSYTIDMRVPLPVENLQVTFDYEKSVLNMSFIQRGEISVHHWGIFYKKQGEETFKKFARAINNGVTDVDFSVPFIAVADGTIETITFVVVSFPDEDEETYSQNSNEISVVIDRRPSPQPPSGLIIKKIAISVQ